MPDQRTLSGLLRILKKATLVGVALLAWPAIAMSHSAGSAHHHHTKPTSTGKHSCPSWDDRMQLTSYTRVSARNLACTTVLAVEAKLVPVLSSGSGPRKPVKESIGKTTFVCKAKLKLTFPGLRLIGPGNCVASKHRSFTFLATVTGQ